MNFDRSQPHLDCLRELIQRFQKVDRHLSSQNSIAILHSFIYSCSKKDFRVEWKPFILTTFPEHSINFQFFISALFFIQHDEDYPPEWLPPPTSLLDIRFRACIWPMKRIGLCDRDQIYWVRSHHRRIHPSFKDAAVSSAIWTVYLSFLFHEDTDSVITHKSNRILLCHQSMI